MNQKSFILVVLSSLKTTTNVSSKLLHNVVTLLAIPFVSPNIQQTEKDSITEVFNFKYYIIYQRSYLMYFI